MAQTKYNWAKKRTGQAESQPAVEDLLGGDLMGLPEAMSASSSSTAAAAAPTTSAADFFSSDPFSAAPTSASGGGGGGGGSGKGSATTSKDLFGSPIPATSTSTSTSTSTAGNGGGGAPPQFNADDFFSSALPASTPATTTSTRGGGGGSGSKTTTTASAQPSAEDLFSFPSPPPSEGEQKKGEKKPLTSSSSSSSSRARPPASTLPSRPASTAVVGDDREVELMKEKLKKYMKENAELRSRIRDLEFNDRLDGMEEEAKAKPAVRGGAPSSTLPRPPTDASAMFASSDSSDISPQAAVDSLRKTGSEALLRMCKGYQSKMKCLDVALRTADPDVALTVILFLRDTLHNDLFFRLISTRKSDLLSPMAIYCAYLKGNGHYERYHQMMDTLQRPRDAAQVLLEAMVKEKDLGKKAQRITRAQQYCESRGLSEEATACKNYLSHCKRTLAIEDFDKQAAESGEEEIWRQYPRQNIALASVYQTCVYCATYHPFTDKKKLSSVEGMRLENEMTEKAVVWSALRGRGRLRDFETLAKIPKKKGLLHKVLKAAVPLDYFLEVIHKHGGPQELIEKLAENIEDPVHRFEASKSFGAYMTAIQTLRDKIKSKAKAEELREFLVTSYGAVASAEWRDALDAALADRKVKWKA